MRLSSRLTRSCSVIALPGDLVAQVGHDRVADEQRQRQLMNLRTASDIVLGRVDVASRMQPHMDATNDLPGSARRVMLLDDLHLELHVLGKSRRHAHGEILGIELEAEIDQVSACNCMDPPVAARHPRSIVLCPRLAVDRDLAPRPAEGNRRRGIGAPRQQSAQREL